jgi:hypothetical protein
MHSRGCISIHGVGWTIIVNVILKYGALGGILASRQISFVRIFSDKLK